MAYEYDLEISKEGKDKKFLVRAYEGNRLFDKIESTTSKEFLSMIKDLPYEISSAVEFKIKNTRLKSGECRKYSSRKTRVITVLKAAEDYKYSLEPLEVQEVGDGRLVANGTTFKLGEDHGSYKLYFNGEISNEEFPHQAFLSLGERPELLEMLEGICEENSHRDGDIGNINGVTGAWVSSLPIFIGDSCLYLAPLEYPVFIPKVPEFAYDQDGVKFPKVLKGEFSVSQKDMRENITDKTIFASIVLPVGKELYFFSVSEASPLLVSCFNYKTPNLNDTEDLLHSLGLDISALRVSSMKEAMVTFMKLSSGDPEVAQGNNNLYLKMFNAETKRDD